MGRKSEEPHWYSVIKHKPIIGKLNHAKPPVKGTGEWNSVLTVTETDTHTSLVGRK